MYTLIVTPETIVPFICEVGCYRVEHQQAHRLLRRYRTRGVSIVDNSAPAGMIRR